MPQQGWGRIVLQTILHQGVGLVQSVLAIWDIVTVSIWTILNSKNTWNISVMHQPVVYVAQNEDHYNKSKCN